MRAEGAYPQGTWEGQRSLPEVRDGFYKEELMVLRSPPIDFLKQPFGRNGHTPGWPFLSDEEKQAKRHPKS